MSVEFNGIRTNYECMTALGLPYPLVSLLALDAKTAQDEASQYYPLSHATICMATVTWDDGCVAGQGEVVVEGALSNGANAPAVEIARFTCPGPGTLQAINLCVVTPYVRHRIATSPGAGTVSSTHSRTYSSNLR